MMVARRAMRAIYSSVPTRKVPVLHVHVHLPSMGKYRYRYCTYCTVTLNGEIGRDLASVGGQDLKKEFMKLKSLSIDSPAANHATFSGPRGRVEFQKRATLLLPLERIASHKELVIVPERELPGCSRK